MIIFALAWRNLWRHPIRSALTALAIMVATGVLVFFIGLQRNSYAAMIKATTSIMTGQIQIQPEGYLHSPKVESVLENVPQLIEAAKSVAGVTSVSPRAIGFALISSAERTYGAQVVGVDPESERQVSSIPGLIVSGRYVANNDTPEVALGDALARNLKVSIGDEVTLLGQGRDGSVAAETLKLVGVFRSGSNDADRAMAQISLPAFRQIFTLGDAAHTIVLQTKRVDELESIQQELQRRLPKTAGTLKPVALRWDEIMPGVKEAIVLDMSAGWLFFCSLVVISTFGLVNTLLMSVLERTREFGTMMAIGLSRVRLFQLLFTESAMLTLLGLVLGIAIGCGFLLYFGEVGFSVPGAEEMEKKWNVPATIYPRLTLEILTVGPALVLAMSLLGSLYPAIRAAWLNTLEALRST